MENILETIVAFAVLCLVVYLWLRVNKLETEAVANRRLIQATIWTLKSSDTLNLDKLSESIQVALGRVQPEKGSRDDLRYVFGEGVEQALLINNLKRSAEKKASSSQPS